MIDLLKFSRNLKEHLIRAGLTYDTVARLALTTKSAVHRACNGRAAPNRDWIIRVALAIRADVMETEALLSLAGHVGLLESSRHSGRLMAKAARRPSPPSASPDVHISVS